MSGSVADTLRLSIPLLISSNNSKEADTQLKRLQFKQPLTPTSVAGNDASAVAWSLELVSAVGVSSLHYSTFPANFNGGMHTAPAEQFVVIISGVAEISMPAEIESRRTIRATAGEESCIFFAADMHGTGHETRFETASTVLQIRFERGLQGLIDTGVAEVVEY